MTANQVLHETIVIERTYDAAIARVFAAFADPVMRAKWGAPSDTAVIIYDKANFAIGGRDVFRCGAKSDPTYHGETHYLHIVPEATSCHPRRLTLTARDCRPHLRPCSSCPRGHKPSSL